MKNKTIKIKFQVPEKGDTLSFTVYPIEGYREIWYDVSGNIQTLNSYAFGIKELLNIPTSVEIEEPTVK